MQEELLALLREFKLDHLSPKFAVQGFASTSEVHDILEKRKPEDVAAKLELKVVDEASFEKFCNHIIVSATAAAGASAENKLFH